MNMLRSNGEVIQYNDEYVIVKFAKGCLSFESKDELYTNISEIEVMIKKDGTIPYDKLRYPFLIDLGNKRSAILDYYMLSTVLLWDNWALKKELNKLVGIEWND